MLSESVFDSLVHSHTLYLLRSKDPFTVARITSLLHTDLFILHDVDNSSSPRDSRLCLPSVSAILARSSIVRHTFSISVQSPIAPSGLILPAQNVKGALLLKAFANCSASIANVNALCATVGIRTTFTGRKYSDPMLRVVRIINMAANVSLLTVIANYDLFVRTRGTKLCYIETFWSHSRVHTMPVADFFVILLPS